MKYQALFCSKDKSKKKMKVLSAAVLPGSLRAKTTIFFYGFLKYLRMLLK